MFLNFFFGYPQKIEFVAKLLNCRYRGMRRVINSMKAREFVFKKPKLGSINLKTLPLLAKNSFISSIETECQRNPLRMTKLFRLRISDILPYMQWVFQCCTFSKLNTFWSLKLFLSRPKGIQRTSFYIINYHTSATITCSWLETALEY